MSTRPWPLQFMRMTFCLPSSLALIASRIVMAMAWFVSGALMKPSVRAKVMPAWKVSSCGTASGRMQTVQDELANRGRHAMISEPAGMDRSRNKAVPQGVHGQERGHHDRVPEVIGKRPSGHGRAGHGFHGDDVDLLAVDLVPDKGEGTSGEVAPSTAAPDDHIRVVACNRHLLLALQAVDGLMEHDVVQHAAQGILAVLARDSGFDGLTDGNAEASRENPGSEPGSTARPWFPCSGLPRSWPPRSPS